MSPFPIKSVICWLKTDFYQKQQIKLKTECENKPKLRTFVKLKEFGKVPPHVYKPLTFLERKVVSKTRLGILPIRLETARYLRPILPEVRRLCYCNNGEIESELHVIFSCDKYNRLRLKWSLLLSKPENFETLPNIEKLKIVLNDPENVRHTASFLIELLDLRTILNDLY